MMICDCHHLELPVDTCLYELVRPCLALGFVLRGASLELRSTPLWISWRVYLQIRFSPCGAWMHSLRVQHSLPTSDELGDSILIQFWWTECQQWCRSGKHPSGPKQGATATRS